MLSVICTGVVSAHLWWIHRYAVVPFGDTLTHLHYAAADYRVLCSHVSLPDKLFFLWTWPRKYPPLVYACTAVYDRWFGTGLHPSVASLSIFLPILMSGAYLLGRATRGPLIGAALALLVAADPLLLDVAHCYFLELPVISMMVMALALLVLSDGFSRAGISMLLGVVLGLGFLAKFSMLFFVAAPLAMAGLEAVVRTPRPGRSLLFFAGLLTPLILLAWQAIQDPLLGVAHFSVGRAAAYAALWSAECIVPWAVAPRLLGARAANLARCLCLAAFAVGPWLLADGSCMFARHSELQHHSAREILAWCDMLVGSLPPHIRFLYPLGFAAIIWSLRRGRTMLPVLLALCGGGLLTLLLQPTYSYHYLAPLTVLMTLVASAWIPRRLWAAAPVLLGSLGVAAVVFAGPLVQEAVPLRTASVLRMLMGYTQRPLPLPPDPTRRFVEQSANEVLACIPPSTTTLMVVATDDPFGSRDIATMLGTCALWQGRHLQVFQLFAPPGGRSAARIVPLRVGFFDEPTIFDHLFAGPAYASAGSGEAVVAPARLRGGLKSIPGLWGRAARSVGPEVAGLRLYLSPAPAASAPRGSGLPL